MIFDIEADGLLDKATKIHVMAYDKGDGVKYTFSYKEMRRLLIEAKQLTGHNIILYDIPALEKLLNIKIKAELVDTLAISWYANHKRNMHGLEWYGEDYGIPKPKINDWENLTPEEYAHRCVEDVKINKRVWNELNKKLDKICDTEAQKWRTIRYLSFKMSCVRLQHDSRWLMDKGLVEETLQDMLAQEGAKLEELKQVMPTVPVFAKKNKPAKPYKKDGTLSVTGANWFKLLKDEGLPEEYEGEVKVKVSEKEPNPASHAQVKDWLFSLGWDPASFKYEKNDDGSERKIPQVRVEGEDGKELCKSVLLLAGKNPQINVLEGLSVIQHRIAILKGFLSNANDKGELIADIGGLTNTLRFKHRVLVNLPGVHKPYGDKIRGALVAREGYELCGSDMSSLEETTKKHFMFPFDPDFVKEMSKDGFDAHLDLAKHAGRISQGDIDRYNEIKGKLKNDIKVSDKDFMHHTHISLVRKIYKAANYA